MEELEGALVGIRLVACNNRYQTDECGTYGLGGRANSRTDRAEDARRARLILLLVEGHTCDEVSERIECSGGFVASWNKRFVEQRIAGLYSRHLGQVDSVLTPEFQALSAAWIRVLGPDQGVRCNDEQLVKVLRLQRPQRGVCAHEGELEVEHAQP